MYNTNIMKIKEKALNLLKLKMEKKMPVEKMAEKPSEVKTSKTPEEAKVKKEVSHIVTEGVRKNYNKRSESIKVDTEKEKAPEKTHDQSFSPKMKKLREELAVADKAKDEKSFLEIEGKIRELEKENKKEELRIKLKTAEDARNEKEVLKIEDEIRKLETGGKERTPVEKTAQEPSEAKTPKTLEETEKEIGDIPLGHERAEIEKEIENLPPEDKEKIGWGLSTIGFKVEKAKNDFFARVFDKQIPGVNEKGTAGRFLAELRDSFVRDSKTAVKKAEEVESGEKKYRLALANAGTLSGNILKYGRAITDLTGASLASPLRYVMMAGMGATRLAEAGKEARLKNEEVIEQTRIQDAEKAYEEAWKIHERAQAKEKTGNISAEALKNAYMMEMPKDLQERITRNPSVANTFIQNLVKKDLGWAVKKLNNSIEKIEKNKKLSLEQKEVEKEKLLMKQKKNLEDYDRIITQYGTVDALAMAGRYAQTAGKAVVAVVTVETLYLSAEKIWGTASNIFHHLDDAKEALPSSVATPDSPQYEPGPHSPESTPVAESEPVVESAPALNPDAVVGKGQGVEHPLIRQIKNNPKLAEALGFDGDVGDEVALRKFAETEAHKIAIKMGYVGEGGKQIHITEADKVAFELKVENGQPVVIEKTVDGKIIETYADEKGYEFGKTPENQYQKVVDQTRPKMAQQNVEKNETPTPESTPKQTLEDIEKQLEEKAEQNEKDLAKTLKQEITTKIDTANSADTLAEKPEPSPQYQAKGFGTTVEVGSKVNIGREIRTGETIFTGSEMPIGGNYGNRPTTLTFGEKMYFLDPFSNQYRDAFGKLYFPEISPEDNLVLQKNSAFADNPFDLSGKELMQVYKATLQDVNFLFNEPSTLGKLSGLRADKLLEYENEVGGDPSVKRLSDYLVMLRNFTGLEPKSGFLGIGAEVNQHYIIRAYQKLAELGKLETFQASLRK